MLQIDRDNQLILVFVEVGLIGRNIGSKSWKQVSLNPCFRGSWFDRKAKVLIQQHFVRGLNPCFRGSWFDGELKSNSKSVKMSLNPCFRGSWFDGLHEKLQRMELRCLNPCFRGSWFDGLVYVKKLA